MSPFDSALTAARQRFRAIMMTALTFIIGSLPLAFSTGAGAVSRQEIGTVVVGESRTFQGGIDWLRENGVNVIDLDNQECVDLLGDFISRHPDIWNEDIGE